MITVGYVRVSTDEQAQSGLSLTDQRKKIAAQATVSELDLQEIIADEGLSGKNTNRPGLQRILSMVHSRQVECVVVAKLDRLSRDASDTILLVDTFNDAQCALISCCESLDTTSANGRFFVNMLGSLAQLEREKISERTRDALATLKAQGKRAGKIPYGFDAGSDGTLFEHEQEQEVLSLIRSGHQAGDGWQKIATCLNEAGHRTRTGSTFTRHRVYRIAKSIGLTLFRSKKKIEQVREAFGDQAARQAEQGNYPDEQALQKALANRKGAAAERRYDAKGKAAKLKGEA